MCDQSRGCSKRDRPPPPRSWISPTWESSSLSSSSLSLSSLQLFYIRSKRSNVLNVHGGVGDGGGDSTYEKALNIELTDLKSDKEGIVIHIRK